MCTTCIRGSTDFPINFLDFHNNILLDAVHYRSDLLI